MNQAAGIRYPARRMTLAGFVFLLGTFHFTDQTSASASSSETATPTHTTQVSLTPSPSPTSTPTFTPTLAPYPTPTRTHTPTITPSHTPTTSPTETSSPTSTPSTSPTFPSSSTPSATGTFTPSPSQTPSATGTFTPSPSPTPTLSLTPTAPSTPYPPQTLMINELAWAGTFASAHDEWIELYNPSGTTINLSGWNLTDGGDIRISLQGSIAPHAYFLLERTDNSTIADVAADQIYTGSLRNSGEMLWLRDPSDSLVDSANDGGGTWPAGNSSSRASMERHPSGNWGTFTGVGSAGHDSKGNPIQGTPRQKNSLLLPPPTTTLIPEPTLTPTPTIDPEITPTPISPQTILINEIAWAGTLASSSDEWIELFNPADHPIQLEGWLLTDGNDIQIALTGTIPVQGFFLLERTDDTTISSLPADLIFTGGLSNSGETLWLKDPSGMTIDSANIGGGKWSAGEADSRESMERRGGFDHPGNWGTFTGHHQSGNDAKGNPIRGTPGTKNSLLLPKPAPMWYPGRIRINEVLIRPHYDWEGKGGVDTGDEFIELVNLGPGKVFLKGWILDDIEGGGSKPYKLPGITLKPGSFVALFHTQTGISLNDTGDTVRLLRPDGTLVEEVRYLRVSAYNLSYGRLPDGSGHLNYSLWPTPNEPNLLYDEPYIPITGTLPPICPVEGEQLTHLTRHLRHPAQVRWMRAQGYGICN